MAINLRVVDIYHLDVVNSFDDAEAAGLWGVIHKATTGATGHDDEYAARRQQALDAGLLWGAYHWGTAAPVADQVDNFLNVAQPKGDTLVALDFEKTVGNQMTLPMAKQFLQGIETALGRKAVLYSGDLIKSSLGATVDPFFGSHRLWLAHYNPNPVCQASWRTYWLWQYTDKRGRPGLAPDLIPGIPGNANGDLDCNNYDRGRAQLTAEWAS
ncbi:MAG TPA: glycoside hydrolase family 25 protein [Pseudolabrys sp.]|nr:glycoside hydrolase family 25 protein [Pseudolabrys sp.]